MATCVEHVIEILDSFIPLKCLKKTKNSLKLNLYKLM